MRQESGRKKLPTLTRYNLSCSEHGTSMKPFVALRSCLLQLRQHGRTVADQNGSSGDPSNLRKECAEPGFGRKAAISAAVQGGEGTNRRLSSKRCRARQSRTASADGVRHATRLSVTGFRAKLSNGCGESRQEPGSPGSLHGSRFREASEAVRTRAQAVPDDGGSHRLHRLRQVAYPSQMQTTPHWTAWGKGLQKDGAG